MSASGDETEDSGNEYELTINYDEDKDAIGDEEVEQEEVEEGEEASAEEEDDPEEEDDAEAGPSAEPDEGAEPTTKKAKTKKPAKTTAGAKKKEVAAGDASVKPKDAPKQKGYRKHVLEAIWREQSGRGGISKKRIMGHIKEHMLNGEEPNSAAVRNALKKCISQGWVNQVSGNGVSGSFRMEAKSKIAMVEADKKTTEADKEPVVKKKPPPTLPKTKKSGKENDPTAATKANAKGKGNAAAPEKTEKPTKKPLGKSASASKVPVAGSKKPAEKKTDAAAKKPVAAGKKPPAATAAAKKPTAAANTAAGKKLAAATAAVAAEKNKKPAAGRPKAASASSDNDEPPAKKKAGVKEAPKKKAGKAK